jgi:hypothetical protein
MLILYIIKHNVLYSIDLPYTSYNNKRLISIIEDISRGHDIFRDTFAQLVQMAFYGLFYFENKISCYRGTMAVLSKAIISGICASFLKLYGLTTSILSSLVTLLICF